MIKKFALALALAALLCLSCALAATDVTIDTGLPQFDVRFVFPDYDVPVETETVDGACLILFGDARSEDPNQLQLFATITSSEETAFDGVTLDAETSDEQIKGLFDYCVGILGGEDDVENPYTYEVIDMDDGVRAIRIIDETLRDEIWLLTIRDGLFVETFGMYPDFHEVTDEDVTYATQLMDAIKFVEKEPEPLLDGNGGEVPAPAPAAE